MLEIDWGSVFTSPGCLFIVANVGKYTLISPTRNTSYKKHGAKVAAQGAKKQRAMIGQQRF